jgi:hypothetical protein
VEAAISNEWPVEPSAIEEIKVGAAGLEWVIENLTYGHALARAVLEAHDLGRGQLVALLAPGTLLERAHRVREGNAGVEGATTYLGGLIIRHNRRALQNCVLVEDACSRPTDPWMTLRPPPFPVLIQGEYVYYLADARHTDNMDPASVGKEAGRHCIFPVVGVFTHLPHEQHPTDARVPVSEATLDTLARNAVGLYVAAYDGESYLIWRRHEPDSV